MLDGKAPADVLSGNWSPDDAGPRSVRVLGMGLVDAMATCAVAQRKVAEMPEAVPELSDGILRGDEDSYPACQAEAQRLRDLGHQGLVAPSAAIREGDVSSRKPVGEVNVPGPEHPAIVAALFGPCPDLDGWLLVWRRSASPRARERPTLPRKLTLVSANG
jgi:hypothetical protein